MDVLRADNSVKNWRKLPIRNPKSDLYKSLYTPSLEKMHNHLLKLSFGNEDSQRDTIIPRHYRFYTGLTVVVTLYTIRQYI